MPDTANAERGYTITRTFDAPRSLVWRAVTEAELFAKWFGGDEASIEIHEWDFRPDGMWRGTMTYGDLKMPWAGRFIEIDEPGHMAVAVIDESTIGDTFETITYTLTEDGDRTEFVLRQHGGHLSDEEYEQAREGSAGFLDALAVVLSEL